MNSMLWEINRGEINSLLFYQWGCDEITMRKDQKGLESFYHIKDAYTILNVLLSPDMKNETVRFIDEGCLIDILDQFEELLNVYRNLFSAMCKYSLQLRMTGYICIGKIE